MSEPRLCPVCGKRMTVTTLYRLCDNRNCPAFTPLVINIGDETYADRLAARVAELEAENENVRMDRDSEHTNNAWLSTGGQSMNPTIEIKQTCCENLCDDRTECCLIAGCPWLVNEPIPGITPDMSCNNTIPKPGPNCPGPGRYRLIDEAKIEELWKDMDVYFDDGPESITEILRRAGLGKGETK